MGSVEKLERDGTIHCTSGVVFANAELDSLITVALFCLFRCKEFVHIASPAQDPPPPILPLPSELFLLVVFILLLLVVLLYMTGVMNAFAVAELTTS